MEQNILIVFKSKFHGHLCQSFSPDDRSPSCAVTCNFSVKWLFLGPSQGFHLMSSLVIYWNDNFCFKIINTLHTTVKTTNSLYCASSSRRHLFSPHGQTKARHLPCSDALHSKSPQCHIYWAICHSSTVHYSHHADFNMFHSLAIIFTSMEINSL